MKFFFSILSFILPFSMKEEVIGDLYELKYGLEQQGKSKLETNLIVVLFGLKIAFGFPREFFLESIRDLLELLPSLGINSTPVLDFFGNIGIKD